MKIYALIACVVTLLIAGEVARRSSLLQGELADAEQRLVLGSASPSGSDTLEEATSGLSRVPVLGSRLESTVRTHQATTAYWRVYRSPACASRCEDRLA